MCINFGIFRGCKNIGEAAMDPVAPISYTSLNLREEYANAFRTESYTELWSRVIDFTLAGGAGLKPNYRPDSSARSPSYRLFVEGLLDPDQTTATKILAHSRNDTKTHTLLLDFYSQTANASLLCGLLLRDIDRIRTRYRPIRSAIRSDNPQSISQFLNNFTSNPFNLLASTHFKQVRSGSLTLLDQLDLNRRKARTKSRSIARIKTGLAIFFVALTVSVFVAGACIVVHGLIALVTLPGLIWKSGRLDRVLAQLDTAAKGMYILNRDLDTISRLVERLHDEVEHVIALVRFWMERPRVTEEVAREIWKNDATFNQKLDELEEHLYLCFMTINKARGNVMKEILVAR